jgi:hypothetical protein
MEVGGQRHATIATLMVYLHTKFHISSSTHSSVNAIKLKGITKCRMATILLRYILQK